MMLILGYGVEKDIDMKRQRNEQMKVKKINHLSSVVGHATVKGVGEWLKRG